MQEMNLTYMFITFITQLRISHFALSDLLI